MKITPCLDRILIRLHSTEETTDSGIIITDRHQQVVLQKATVVTLGTGEKVDFLKKTAGLKDGDTILVNKYASNHEICREDKGLRIVLDTDILGVIEDE